MKDNFEKFLGIVKWIGILFLILFGATIISLILEDLYSWEDRNVYCYEKYGEDYFPKYDPQEHYPFCSAILDDETISKYYFYDKDIKNYCEETFWKLNDCPIEREK